MSYFQYWLLLAILVMVTEPPAPRSWGRTVLFCFFVLFALFTLPVELAR